MGAGGHGKVVKETAEAMGVFDTIDFLDDHSDSAIGKCKDYKRYRDRYSHAIVAFGDNELRMDWIKELIDAGFQIPVLIHPTASISPSAMIERGSIICAGAVVSTNAWIRKGCIVSIGALVDHDSLIREGSHLNAGAIVTAGSCVSKLTKLDAGVVFSNTNKGLSGYSFEVGV